MPFCPNCSAPLSPEECESSCSKCGALFGPGSTWSPESRPVEPDQPSLTMRVVKGVIAVPLFLIGFGFLLMGLRWESFALVPATVAFMVGFGVATARSKTGVAVAGSIGATLILMVWGGLHIVGAAIHAR